MGKHPDELLGTINWQLKSAYAVALGGESARAISGYAAEKVRPVAEKFGVKKLIDAFALCTDTHFLIRSTGVDGLLALELLVVKLAAPRSKPKASASRA
jgi:DNA polymerase III delta subunit